MNDDSQSSTDSIDRRKHRNVIDESLEAALSADCADTEAQVIRALGRAELLSRADDTAEPLEDHLVEAVKRDDETEQRYHLRQAAQYLKALPVQSPQVA
jgi:hypothetical protein